MSGGAPGLDRLEEAVELVERVVGAGPGLRVVLDGRGVVLEQLQALSWLPNPVAEAVYEKVHAVAVPTRRPRQPVPFTDDETGANPT